MFRRLLHFLTGKFERQFNYDMGYAHEIIDIGPVLFLRFSMIRSMDGYRANAPASAWYAAKLVATLQEDCGPCTQLVIDMASNDGVADKQLKAIVQADPASMNDDTRLGWQFTSAALTHSPEVDEFRLLVEERWGKKAVVALTYAMAGARIYPTVKYALGHGKQCQQLQVGSNRVRPAISIESNGDQAA